MKLRVTCLLLALPIATAMAAETPDKHPITHEAYASNLSTALVLIAIMGFGVTLKNIVGQILLQLTLTDDIRGRVFSVYGMLFGSAPGIGALAMGWTGDRIGIALPILVGAAIGLVSSLVILVNRRRLTTLMSPSTEAGP
jgi:predicted MFS family arabinose efflux permease